MFSVFGQTKGSLGIVNNAYQGHPELSSNKTLANELISLYMELIRATFDIQLANKFFYHQKVKHEKFPLFLQGMIFFIILKTCSLTRSI